MSPSQIQHAVIPASICHKLPVSEICSIGIISVPTSVDMAASSAPLAAKFYSHTDYKEELHNKKAWCQKSEEVVVEDLKK